MADCIFCAIAAGDIPSAKVWEDERTFAFLDIDPLRKGHALVIPKTHAARLEETDPEDAAAVLRTARLLLPALITATGDPDATVAINNGPSAGQAVPHVHLHIVPRRQGDGMGSIHSLAKATVPEHDAAALAAEVASHLGGI